MSKRGKIKLEVECEVRDKDGKLISKHRQEAKSLLKRFLQILNLIYIGSTGSLTDTGGVGRTFNPGVVPVCRADAGAGTDTYGGMVGTGTTGVTRDDYGLASKIAHGSGAGQLAYGATTVEAPNGTPPSTILRIIRVFTNNYTSPLTVNEIGYAINNSAYFYLNARDVLSTPQTVPAGATLTVRYIFTITA